MWIYTDGISCKQKPGNLEIHRWYFMKAKTWKFGFTQMVFRENTILYRGSSEAACEKRAERRNEKRQMKYFAH